MTSRVSFGVVPLLLVLATLSGSMPARSQDRGDDERIRDQFIGAWRLMWLEEPGADGTVHKADCTGMLVFTREGRMSVQVMYRDSKVGTATGPVQYAQGGYEATFGRYEVDAGAGTFTYRRGRAGAEPGWQGADPPVRVVRQPAHREVRRSRGALASGLGTLPKRVTSDEDTRHWAAAVSRSPRSGSAAWE